MKTMIRTLVAILLGLSFVWIFAKGKSFYDRAKRNEVELQSYEHAFRFMSGYHVSIGHYKWMSTDCGRTWYNFDHTDEKPIKTESGYRSQRGYTILDKANPAHVKKILAWEILSNRVAKDGELNPMNAADRALLEDAGFTIELAE